MDPVFSAALARGVAFVPGRHFFADPRLGRDTMRLNFTNAGPQAIKWAVGVLADVIGTDVGVSG
jgi:2-aminoadipate transaminase